MRRATERAWASRNIPIKTVDGLVDSGHGLDCDRLHASYVEFAGGGSPLSIVSAARSTVLGSSHVDTLAVIKGRLRTPLVSVVKSSTRKKLLRNMACESVYLNGHASVKTNDTIGLVMSFHAKSLSGTDGGASSSAGGANDGSGVASEMASGGETAEQFMSACQEMSRETAALLSNDAREKYDNDTAVTTAVSESHDEVLRRVTERIVAPTLNIETVLNEVAYQMIEPAYAERLFLEAVVEYEELSVYDACARAELYALDTIVRGRLVNIMSGSRPAEMRVGFYNIVMPRRFWFFGSTTRTVRRRSTCCWRSCLARRRRPRCRLRR